MSINHNSSGDETLICVCSSSSLLCDTGSAVRGGPLLVYHEYNIASLTVGGGRKNMSKGFRLLSRSMIDIGAV